MTSIARDMCDVRELAKISTVRKYVTGDEAKMPQFKLRYVMRYRYAKL
jgi:hypothetical protein